MESFPINSSPIFIPASIISASPEETYSIGRKLALLLDRGSVIALTGPLGAGKTCLVKGIARELGVREEVTSPTYTIVSEYEAVFGRGKTETGKKIPFFHIDAYRLEGDDDFSAMGGEEIVFGNGISVIEWGERIPAFIPPEALRVDIVMDRNDKRLIRVYRGHNPFTGANS